MEFDSSAAGMAWFCFSIPVILTVFFRFSRVWSLRNLDLALLLCVATGVALLRQPWADAVTPVALLLIASGLLLVRLLSDNYLEKRPRIETNLSPPALGFLGLCGTAVLIAAITGTPPPQSSRKIVDQGKDVLNGQTPPTQGQTTAAVSTAVNGPARQLSDQVVSEPEEGAADRIAAGILAGLGHLAILGALMFIGIRHFQNWQLSIAMATLYVLLPSTILDPNSVSQIMPAAWILWALALHRVPWAAGILMGLACGSLLYPAFLLPVWLAYYGRNRVLRFGVALLAVWAVLLGGFAILSANVLSYVRDSLQVIAGGATALVVGEMPVTLTDQLYRAPIMGLFVVMLIALTVWPRVKRFEHLLAASAATIVGVQFWYPPQIGEFLTGYIPLVVLVAFRPRLHHPGAGQEQRARTDRGHLEDRTQLEPVLSGNGSSLFR